MIQFTDAALGKMGHQMVSTQTKRFIVYSDMSQEESKYWISLVDKMYDRLTETFDLDKSDNIWRGKCLLLFFKNEADYHRYNQAAYGRALQGSAGVCRTMGNGEVHILMRQSRDRDSTGYILVHEAVHGFLARYQSSIHVQSWLNEGLAEFVSEQLVKAGVVERKKRSAREIVKRSGRIRDFLTARNIDFEYYGMAYDITDMMIQENRKGYVKMIQGIKNGLTVQQAFETEYGVPLDKVFDYYAKTRLEIEHLKLN